MLPCVDWLIRPSLESTVLSENQMIYYLMEMFQMLARIVT